MLALLAAVLALAPQEPRIEASVSATTVRAGDAFVYQIVVASDDAAPSRVVNPHFPSEFEVLRTQDFSETQLSFPGGRTRRFRREIVLVVHTPGVHTIPSAQIEIAGRHYTTPELQVVVAGAGPTVGGGSAAAPGQPRLRVEFVPDTVYVGQQVLLRAEAVIPEGRRPRRGRAPTFETPQPAGFWTQELPEARHSSLRLVGSGVYEVHGFSRAYFPLSSGARTFAPASVVYEARQDWFSGTRLERVTARDSLRLEVRPLPVEGRPRSFGGAVGKFMLETRLEPRRLRAGEAATLVVEISGEGNVKGLPPPVLPELDGVDVLPAGDEAESWVSDGIVHGTRRFRWMLVPRAGPAALELGGIEFAWFDPHAREYETARSDVLTLDVLPGPGVATAAAALALEPPRLRPSSGERLGWVRSRTFVAMNVAPLLVLLGFAGVRYGRRRPARRPRRPDAAWRAWRVRSTSAALTPDSLRLAFLRSAAEAADVDRSRIADPPGLAACLEGLGVRRSVIEDALRALASIDAVRFSGRDWTDKERARLVDELGRALHALIGELRGRAAATPAIGVVAFLIVTLAAAAAPASAGRQPGGEHVVHGAEFARATAAYEQGDYDAAIEHFRAHLAGRPHDAAAWFNLGAAHAAAGRRGDAIAAWLRAAAEDPRDAEVRSRLQAAGADRAVAVMTPPLPLTGNEARLALALLWLATLTGAALLLAGRRRPGMRLVVAGLALLVLFGTTAGAHTFERTRSAIATAEPTMLRSAPAARADELARVPPGTVLRVVERRAGWLRVEHGRSEGWVDARDALTP